MFSDRLISANMDGPFELFLSITKRNRTYLRSSIAVAPDGAIYVTGYSANTSGGSDITTIKYAALTAIQKESDGSIQLQCFGTPGSNYVVQAATNLLNWADLGSALADTNGLFQFLDTNAPLFPQRFYRWHVP